MRVISVRERERLPIGAGERLTIHDADALASLLPVLPSGALIWEHKAIRIGPFCGVMRSKDLVLEVLPKVRSRLEDDSEAQGTLIGMLRVVGELKLVSPGRAALDTQRVHLLDIFIEDFCGRLSDLLRHGAIRSYQEQEGNLAALRGRLQLTEQMRRHVVDRSLLCCRFDELSVDNPHNRALKHVLGRLLAAARDWGTKGIVSALLHRMQDVTSAVFSAADVCRLPFDRLNRRWLLLFERAAWLLRGLYPDVRSGQVDGCCLLFDMQRLFESFVGALLRKAWSTAETTVRLQGPPLYMASTGDQDVFRMRPDITVLDGRQDVLAIADAKWKQLDICGAAGVGVGQNDVYQVACYAARYRTRNIALVYPAAAGTPLGLLRTFKLHEPPGTAVSVHALDVPALARGGAIPKTLIDIPFAS